MNVFSSSRAPGDSEKALVKESRRGLEKIYIFGSLSNVIGFIGLIVLSLSLFAPF